MATQLQIPPLVRFVIRREPGEKSLGIQVRQGVDDAVEGEFEQEHSQLLAIELL